MFSQVLKTLVRTSLVKMGFEIRRSMNPVVFDLSRNEVKHPVEAIYKANGNPCYVKVPLSRIVSFEYAAFPLSIEAGHPFLVTLKEYESNPKLTAENSLLGKYYQLFQPANASDVMGLASPSCRDLKVLPAWASPPLWSLKTPEEYLDYIKILFQKEDVSQGVSIGKFMGGSTFGPVEPRKLRLEYARLIGVYESIKKSGYRFDASECVTGTVWVDDGRWVVSVSSGQHRIASLAALGYEHVIVELQSHKALGGVMCKSCCEYFPTVINGIHNVKEAQKIFDRIIRGKPPEAASNWIDYCNTIFPDGKSKTRPHRTLKSVRSV
ncbi:hypothetical protein ACM26W_11640 [Halomonas sp. HK25]|uniref:hypothetical protein n=1 Tax=Halomonas sp. HK25 TaxID=3394321 RepID=UPI0039FC3B1C